MVSSTTAHPHQLSSSGLTRSDQQNTSTSAMQQSAVAKGMKQQGFGGAEDQSSGDNVWSSILSEVRTNASTKMPSGKSVIVLGDNESGKTTLVAKLQGIEAPKKGCGLEYAYIEVRDEYRDDSAQLSVYVLDGNPAHSNLLKFTVSELTLNSTLVILTVSMGTPWAVIEQLKFWAGLLHDHIDSLKLSADLVQELRENCVQKWLEYEIAGDEQIEGRKLEKGMLEELPDSVLSRNMGLEIVVVVTKTDLIPQLERDFDYKDEHFDFIQFHIRQFCLLYGAALFYTSVKEDKNCDLLYKYIVHRMYGLRFRTPALIVEKDAVFIPSGWDNESKMSILQESMFNFKADDFFNGVIQRPVQHHQRKAQLPRSDPEIDVEDEQSYLERQLVILQQQASNPRNTLTPSPHSNKAGQQRSQSSSPAGLLSTGGGTSPSGQMIGGKASKPGDPTTNPSDRVLANFFNSLLSRKSAGGQGSGNSPVKSSGDDSTPTTRTEVAEELDSLLNKKKLSQQNNSSEC